MVDLKQFVTQAKQLCTQINSASVATNAEDHIKSTLTQKLSKATYEQSVNHYSKIDFSLGELFKGIGFVINLFEYQQAYAGESVTVRSASHKPYVSGNKSTTNKVKDNQGSSKPKSCQCQGDHKVMDCTKYKFKGFKKGENSKI